MIYLRLLLQFLLLALVINACGVVRLNNRTEQQGSNAIEDPKSGDESIANSTVVPEFFTQSRGSRGFELAIELVGEPTSIEAFNETTNAKLDVRGAKVDGAVVRFSLSGPINYGSNNIVIQTERQKNLRTKLTKTDFKVFGMSTMSPTQPTKASSIWLNSLSTVPQMNAKGHIQSGFQNIVN